MKKIPCRKKVKADSSFDEAVSILQQIPESKQKLIIISHALDEYVERVQNLIYLLKLQDGTMSDIDPTLAFKSILNDSKIVLKAIPALKGIFE